MAHIFGGILEEGLFKIREESEESALVSALRPEGALDRESAFQEYSYRPQDWESGWALSDSVSHGLSGEWAGQGA